MSGKRRPLSRGCGASTPKTRRERDHLDGRSKANEEDNAKANVRRHEEALQQSFDAGDFVSPLGLSYPSLGRGTCFSRDGRELSSDDRNGILDLIERQRCWYWSRYLRENGTLREEKENNDGKFRPLHQLLITVNPPYSMAFMEMDKTDPERFKKHLKYLTGRMMDEFERATGLETIMVDVHAAEGNLHFHLEFTTVDENNEILWQKLGRGFRKLKRLGIPTTNFLRQVESGFVDKREAKKAYGYLRRRTRGNKGAIPIDYLLATSLDACCERIFEKESDLMPILEKAQGTYQKFVDRKRARMPEKLEEANRKLKDQLKSLENVVVQYSNEQTRSEKVHQEEMAKLRREAEEQRNKDKKAAEAEREASQAAMESAIRLAEQRAHEAQEREEALLERIRLLEAEKKPAPVPKDSATALPFSERLKGYVPAEILEDSVHFHEVAEGLFQRKTSAAYKLLSDLATDLSIPLSQEERVDASEILRIWDDEILGRDRGPGHNRDKSGR